jgi:translation elongation factor EF-G
MLQADVQTVDITFDEYGAASTLGFAAAGAGAASERQPLGSAHVPAHVLHSIQSGLATGFQLASAAGPLCDEPLWGIAFEVGQLFRVSHLE